MGNTAPAKISWRTVLTLGRVSNLPTVWTNSLVGWFLAGATEFDLRLALLLLAMTLFYVGGMYLNDAFDAYSDAHERPERPIPSGEITRTTVYLCGFGMLVLAILILLRLGLGEEYNWEPIFAGCALAIAIIYYNWRHKKDPLSPLWMGICRFLVYLTSALVVSTNPPAIVFVAGAALICYLIGLTYIAKQENLREISNLWPLIFMTGPILLGIWLAEKNITTLLLLFVFVAWTIFSLQLLWRKREGNIPRAVVSLIAGICLLDAILIASATSLGLALLAIFGFFLTLFFQRFIPGT